MKFAFKLSFLISNGPHLSEAVSDQELLVLILNPVVTCETVLEAILVYPPVVLLAIPNMLLLIKKLSRKAANAHWLLYALTVDTVKMRLKILHVLEF